MKRATYDIYFSDIDHFAFKYGSWVSFAMSQGFSKQSHIDLYTSYVKGQISYHEMQRRYRDKLRSVGATKDAVTKFSKAHVSQSHNIIPGYLSYIAAIKEKFGIQKIILVSDTFDDYAQEAKKFFGFDGAYATNNVLYDDEGKILEFEHLGDGDYAKINLIYRACDDYGTSPDRCVAGGDGMTDIPMLKAVGLGHLITPKDPPSDLPSHIYCFQDFEEAIQNL
jgi:phosphoserine phosphatase